MIKHLELPIKHKTGIGHNRVLAPSRPTPKVPPITAIAPSISANCFNTFSLPLIAPFTPTHSEETLLNLLFYTYQVLNSSEPNLTQDCWLCISARPPFYEGIAISGNISLTNNHSVCRWDQHGHKLTLAEIQGTGVCIGKDTPSYQELCNSTLHTNNTNYLIPPFNAWWACSSGITSCVAGILLDKDFCVAIQLVPKVNYCSGGELNLYWELPTEINGSQ